MERRTTHNAAPLYELRGANLLVNGERLPVSRAVVLAGVRAWQAATGELIVWTGGVARIDKALADEILALERATCCRALGRALSRAA